jgi:hypothetical protein
MRIQALLLLVIGPGLAILSDDIGSQHGVDHR